MPLRWMSAFSISALIHRTAADPTLIFVTAPPCPAPRQPQACVVRPVQLAFRLLSSLSVPIVRAKIHKPQNKGASTYKARNFFKLSTVRSFPLLLLCHVRSYRVLSWQFRSVLGWGVKPPRISHSSMACERITCAFQAGEDQGWRLSMLKWNENDQPDRSNAPWTLPLSFPKRLFL